MQILIHSNGVEMTDSLSAHIKSRIGFTLARFNGLIRKIVVSVADENGPKGGVDKTCTVRIKTDQLSELVIRDTESDSYSAVARAVARSKHALARHLQRAKGFKRKRIKSDRHVIGQQQESAQDLSHVESGTVFVDEYSSHQYDGALSQYRY